MRHIFLLPLLFTLNLLSQCSEHDVSKLTLDTSKSDNESLSTRSSYTAKYVIITAKSGLNLREQPSIKSKSIIKLPYGVITLVREIGEEDTIDGNTGHWIKAHFLAEEGWIFDAYTIKPEAFTGVVATRNSLIGSWLGQWDCVGEKTKLMIKQNGKFTLIYLNGGSMGGCSTRSISGEWSLTSEGLLELKTTNSISYFHLTSEEVLVADTISSEPLWENFESEIISGLIKKL